MYPPREQVVFQSSNIDIIYLQAWDAMLMKHRGRPTVEEYKTAFSSLPELYETYPFHYSVSDETELEFIPTEARLWVSTVHFLRPKVRRLVTKQQGMVSIKAQSGIGRTMAAIFHVMLQRTTGKQVRVFETKMEAYQYLEALAREDSKPKQKRIRRRKTIQVVSRTNLF
ncbi:MAG TPA: hypothetical protein DCE41_26820 [Cytophagales bacterium]|nr:hypothetical protein [Cytophagales bacterium]HAA18944.1 hypothetical protein [Cytophagales bacterium]HAP65297.1 hypothetical protein [Cytophagales bacterium]